MAKKELMKLEDKELNVDEIKLEVFEFAKSQISTEIDKEVKKANDRYIKDRNRKIISQKIIIALLVISYLVTIGFLINDHYFDKYLVKNEITDNDINKPNEENKETNKENDKEEQNTVDENELKKQALIEKYSNIFDNYKLTMGNQYLNDMDFNKFILAYAIDNLSSDDFTIDDETYMLNKEVINNKIKEMFNVEIENETFMYNDIEFKYYKKLDYYILNKEFNHNELPVIRKIMDVKEENDIEITSKDYYIKDELVYTIDNNYLCDEKDLDNYLEKIPTKTNKFIKNNDGYYLIVK